MYRGSSKHRLAAQKGGQVVLETNSGMDQTALVYARDVIELPA